MLHFESGQSRNADLYIDASGFRSELLGHALAEPYKSFAGGLFCDRAVIGGWYRTDEHLQAYTTAETMRHGWCWQIEHENFINRGYVYSSMFTDDDTARTELLEKNPRISNEPRIVKYRSGRYERNWVGNCVAIGNSSGFVEPLEATALAQIIYECRWLVDMLQESSMEILEPKRQYYNLHMARAWDEIRDFLAYHYKFNTLEQSDFWTHCREETSLGDFHGLWEMYREIGPSPELIHALPYKPNIYGIEGYLAHLVGMKVPWRQQHVASANEQQVWQKQRNHYANQARNAMNSTEVLAAIRSPSWNWA